MTSYIILCYINIHPCPQEDIASPKIDRVVNFVVIGSTTGCRYDNLRYRQTPVTSMLSMISLGVQLGRGWTRVSNNIQQHTFYYHVTHWGRATYKCVTKLTIIGPDNGLSPGRRQAIIWTNAGILLIRSLGTKFSEILSEINSFSSKKIPLKMSSGKWCQFCPHKSWSLAICVEYRDQTGI